MVGEGSYIYGARAIPVAYIFVHMFDAPGQPAYITKGQHPYLTDAARAQVRSQPARLGQ